MERRPSQSHSDQHHGLSSNHISRGLSANFFKYKKSVIHKFITRRIILAQVKNRICVIELWTWSLDFNTQSGSKRLIIFINFLKMYYHCRRNICFVMHPTIPFCRDHASVIINSNVFVIYYPTITSIKIAIIRIVFVPVLIFANEFAFFQIIRSVSKFHV